MFWLEILLPVSMAILGITILFSNDRNHRSAVTNLIENGRGNLREITGKQKDKSQIKARLNEIGSADANSYKEFRYRQAIVGVTFGLVPYFFNFLMITNLAQAVSFSAFTGIGSYLAYDKHLDSLVKQRRELIEALDEMSRSLRSPSIRRFIDALVMALLRGAPVVEVLHRHVAEARINQRNLVMDKAGKAETTMMIPIVFLILPISVLFALWPSINQLSFFAS